MRPIATDVLTQSCIYVGCQCYYTYLHRRRLHWGNRELCPGTRARTGAVVKVERRIRWHYTTTILRLRIGARLTRYRNCKFHNFARTISRHADGISQYSVPPSAGPLLPLNRGKRCVLPWYLSRLCSDFLRCSIQLLLFSNHIYRINRLGLWLSLSLQLYLLNLTKGAKFAGAVGHPMTKMLSASFRPGDLPLDPAGSSAARPPL